MSNILLTGKPGVGKSTIIQRIIEQLEPGFAAGFWSGELRGERGRVGFSIETLSGKIGTLAHVDIQSTVRVSKYGVNIEDIESIIIPELRTARESGKLIIIDEIAKMELASAGFVDEVTNCLETRRVVGTIQARPHPILNAIKSRPDVELIVATRGNRNEIPTLVIDRLRNLYGKSCLKS